MTIDVHGRAAGSAVGEAQRAGLLENLAGAVGSPHVLCGAETEPYRPPGADLRDREPWAVVKPGSSAEVAAVLRLCADTGTPVVPRGHGSSLSGGVALTAHCVVLSFERLDELEIDATNACAKAGAGVLTARLQSEAQAAGLAYLPDPNSADFSTVGGNLATNAGGKAGLKHGTTADHVLGLTVALADGRLLHLGGKTRRATSGYRLLQLFIGSEGTLGVITEATLKLVPRPVAHAAALVGFESLDQVETGLARLRTTGPLPSALEILDQGALALVAGQLPAGLSPELAAALLVEQEGSDPEQVLGELASVLDTLGGTVDRVAQSEDERRQLWAIAQGLGRAATQASAAQVVEDVAVPPGCVVETLRRLHRLGREEGLMVATSGHAGDGCLHPRLLLEDSRPERIDELRSRVVREALELGGVIAGEYGVGSLKRDLMNLTQDREALFLMHQLKNTLDPRGVLNPGKLLPDPAVASPGGQPHGAV